MTGEKDPGALAGALGADRDIAGQRPDDVTKSAADWGEEPADPFPWLINLSPVEYEFFRRRLSREHGCRVAFLDRLYREARRKAGVPQ